MECGSPPTFLTQDQLGVIIGNTTQNLVRAITLQIQKLLHLFFRWLVFGLEGWSGGSALSQEGNSEHSELCDLFKRSLRVSAGLWLACGMWGGSAID